MMVRILGSVIGWTTIAYCRSSCGSGNTAAYQNPPVDVLRNREGEGRRWFVYPSVVLVCGWAIIGRG
jgi:hypothetical protein